MEQVYAPKICPCCGKPLATKKKIIETRFCTLEVTVCCWCGKAIDDKMVKEK